MQQERLDALFPLPSPPPSPLSPARLPGVTYDSGVALSKCLKDNHEKWHVFFNDKGFHNHATHHLLAIYQLGAGGPLLDAAYQTHVSYMRPAFKSPDVITEQNFHEHLGDEKYYNAYLEFFSSVVLEKGAATALEEYIFSAKANITAPAPGKLPNQMLDRFLAGLLHPLIHTGYGCEFGLPGMLAEGLAQTAVHSPAAPTLIPASLFKHTVSVPGDAISASVARLTALMPSLVLEKLHNVVPAIELKQPKGRGIHALTILAQILNDRDFTPAAIGLTTPVDNVVSAFTRVVETRGERLVALTEAWTVDGADAQEVASKIEELIWMNVIIYGVGGWAGRKTVENGKFNGDFVQMHLVTSVLFLHSLVAYLSPTSTSILLRTYLTSSLAWWVARGRPSLPIRGFYESVTAHPVEHGVPHVPPVKDALVREDPSPNPWLPILQTTLMHPNEHLCKLQRALPHFSVLYGTKKPGDFAHLAESADAPLEGADVLDGTLFLRVAGLTAERLGWMREGEENKGWDFKGFFD